MYPLFGIDSNRGYLTNVKKGSMQHFLSSKPSSPKIHYIKPVPQKYEQRFRYTQPPQPRPMPPRPYRDDVVPMGNILTPATYRDVFPNKPYSHKQELIYKQALTDDSKQDKSNDVYVHNAEYSPMLSHKDIIFGKPVDPVIPPPNMKKEPNFYVRPSPNQLGPTFYHSYVPKVFDFEKGPYSEKYPGPYAPTKNPYAMFRKGPQIEYFMPQDQEYANIKIHTDMNKSVKVESHNHAEVYAPSTKYHSTVKFQKDDQPESLFDINQHLLDLSSHAKHSNPEKPQSTETPFIIYAEEVQSKRPAFQKYVSPPIVKPVSEKVIDAQPSTTEINPVVEITKPPVPHNKNRKLRKQSSKILSTEAPSTTSTTTQRYEINDSLEDQTTTNPIICERECIQSLSKNDLEPVCGSDFKTYTNKGNLRCAQTCRRNGE